MLNWRKMILPITALAIAIPVSAYAAAFDTTNDPAAEATPAPLTEQSAPGVQKDPMSGERGHLKMRGGKGMADRIHGDSAMGIIMGKGIGMGDSIHQMTYYTLLAEKYAPETLTAWQNALAERQKLEEQLGALKPEIKERKLSEEKMDMMKQGLKERMLSTETMDELRQTMETKRKELQEKLESGEITKEVLKDQLKDMKGEPKMFVQRIEDQLPEGTLEGVKAELEARRAVQQQFTDAVASKDGVKIKAALAALLEQYVKDTQNLAAKLAERQAQADQNTNAPQTEAPQTEAVPQADAASA